jgi:putative addiction module component (TIGR02574 family)
MGVLLEEALKLPISERIRLADDLYSSVGGSDGTTPLTDAQIAELERRLEDHRKNPEAAIPWDEVRDRWRKRG